MSWGGASATEESFWQSWGPCSVLILVMEIGKIQKPVGKICSVCVF